MKMSQISLYPLRFEPIYQYRLWGGRHLSQLLSKPLPGNEPVGEAWILSDRDDHQSLVADGSLRGIGIGELMKQAPEQLMGKLAGRFERFPLLLKFLDVHEMLSVQVHPSNANAELIPPGESAKTEAWVVLQSGPRSRIFAGLKPGTTEENLREALQDGMVEDRLPYFTPEAGDGVLIPAGTVHALGGDVVVFEVQQNSDVTFRLYDWNHIDPKTGKSRELQVDKALASIDFDQGIIAPVLPVPEDNLLVHRERLFQCDYFDLWRLQGKSRFMVGEVEMPHLLVCTHGEGTLIYKALPYPITKGDLLLLPAIIGVCFCDPVDAITLLEISIPEGA